MTGYLLSHIQEKIPENAVFVIGAGQFGSRATRLIRQNSDAPIIVVDADESRLSMLAKLKVDGIASDGVQFLLKNYHLIHPDHTVIPAVPFHLAYEWLTGYVEGDHEVKKIPVPDQVKPPLPHTWPGSEGSLLVSYADFSCPDDCPEPDYCTVTGEMREKPLHDLLSRLDVPEFNVHVIRSHQLAPGLGGYKAGDLMRAAETLKKAGMGKWLIGTACKCHGILTACEIRLCKRPITYV